MTQKKNQSNDLTAPQDDILNNADANEDMEQYNFDDVPRANESYTAEDMQHLNDREHVRARPSMYIGDVASQGLHHLVNEVVDNSLDEALAGYAQNISVTINVDGSVTVEDDGRGIPVDVHPELQVSTLEGVMTVLKFGGKFTKGAYQTSGGLHGVGVTVVNFLSEWCEVEVCRDGYSFHQEYQRGEPTGPVEQGNKSDKHGTKTTFKPDSEIFQDVKFDYSILYRRLQDLAFLNPRIHIRFHDARDGRGEDFHYQHGLIDFVKNLNRGDDPAHPDVIYVSNDVDGVKVSIALQYSSDYNETVRSYVNNVNTIEGGTHLTGFRRALTNVLSRYGQSSNLFKNITPTGEDFREGLTAVVSVRVPNPLFQGQTKTKLGNVEVEGIVASIFGSSFSKYLEEHPATGKTIIQKSIVAAEARESAKKAREMVHARKNAMNRGGMPGKLRDCTSREVDKCELYLVEGNSAGGSAEGGRIREFQAILPLRGKVINAFKSTDTRVLSNEEVRSMIVAFGAGYGKDMDLSKRRYGKIVIMTDADVDGSHIRTLLLTLFYRQMYDMIKGGFVYAAQPPLFRVRRKGGKGPARYVQTEEEMKKELLEAGIQNAQFDPRDGRLIKDEEITALCHTLSALEDSILALERRGFNLRELAALQDPVTAKLPMFHVSWKKKDVWFFERRELTEYLNQIEQETGQTIEALTGSISAALNQTDSAKFNKQENEEDADDAVSPLRIVELHEIRSMNQHLLELRKFGFEIDSLYTIQRTGVEGSRYALLRGDSEVGVDDLRSLLVSIRQAGEKGWQITRFKGLGEMDPEELRETTLDPANRTLVQITMEDAEAADELFRTLMGEKVEPRREFIEKFALDAKNIDA
ncbi:MAG: DNA gyrase subunit B [Planctomycetia bacterium]|nr:DNA gyrase subunit B [Planctomycetia bacterium]